MPHLPDIRAETGRRPVHQRPRIDPLPTEQAGRRCDKCRAWLSIYNPNAVCWVHLDLPTPAERESMVELLEEVYA